MGLCLLFSWGVFVSVGCSSKPSVESRAQTKKERSAVREAKSEPLYSDTALTGLRELTLYVGPEELTAEIVSTPREIATGLMHRESLAPDRGMLFVFAVPHRASFYMRNTCIPLDIAYLDSDGIVLEIHQGIPFSEAGLEASTESVHYVLEMNSRWFASKGIGPGAQVVSELGLFKDTFRF